MKKKSSGEVKTSIIKKKQKNGYIYAYERKYKYDSVKKNNICLGDTLLGRLVDGNIVETRAKKKNKKEALELTATKTKIGANNILDYIGEKSSIDQNLYDIADIGDARKIISIARYLVSTGGHTLPAIEEWQLNHKLPYEEGISQKVYGELFEKIGFDTNLIQNYFKKRVNYCNTELVIAYDSTTQSTYSNNQECARYGYNKEGLNLPTIKYIILYSIKDEQPIAYSRVPGNLPDVTSILNAIKQLQALGIKVAEITTDNGYYSEANIGELLFQKMNFITLVKPSLKWVKETIDKNIEEFNNQRNYCTNEKNMIGFVVPVTRQFSHIIQKSDKRTGVKKGDKQSFESKIYLHLYLNEEKKLEEDKKNRKEIYEIMEIINNGLNPEELDDKSYKKAQKYLIITKKRGGKYVAEINSDAVRDANKYNGMMALISDKEKTSKSCLEKYRLREKIEENFGRFKDDCDGNRVRVWSDIKYQGRIFVQFVALGYYDCFYSEIKRIKKEIDETISNEEFSKQELKVYRSLKTWLHDMSLERILMWFDTIEETVVSSKLSSKYWTTETTKRDELFLKLLGVNSTK